MMRLHVRHVTTYRFSAPARFVVQSLRLVPAGFTGQKVVEWNVSAAGAKFGDYFTDAAGDRIRTMSISGPVSALEVAVDGIVETADTNGVLSGHRETISPLTYLRATAATRADKALATLAETALAEGTAGTDLERAHRLSAVVAAAIDYQPGVTGMHTTAAEALAQKMGVCQDHAHALIAVAQYQRIPARYVCGYLYVRQDGSAELASHAWAELFVSGLGWVGFDASNQCCPDEHYIRLGSGADAYDAAPIRGQSHGGATESLDVTVAVVAMQQ